MTDATSNATPTEALLSMCVAGYTASETLEVGVILTVHTALLLAHRYPEYAMAILSDLNASIPDVPQFGGAFLDQLVQEFPGGGTA